MENERKLIGVLAGGYSSEREISLASGKTAFDAFATAGYKVLFIELDRDGFSVDGQPVQLEALGLSFVFNCIHGTPGEDGHLSGMLEVLHIPHSTCDTFTSALTFAKFQCNVVLRNLGIRVPKGKSFFAMPAEDEFQGWNFPLFVKPNRSGSSFGVSRIASFDELETAFEAAQKEDREVIIEEGITGTEVGCGVFSVPVDFATHTALPKSLTQAIAITEIVPTESAFFDYEAKYEGKSQEITPARISKSVGEEVELVSKKVYDLLGLKGLVRMDFIIDSQNNPVLIEVNSIPGLSSASIVPQQLAYKGWKISEVLAAIAEAHIH